MSCIWQWTFSRFCGPHTSNWRASSYSKAVRTAWKGARHHETSLPKTKKLLETHAEEAEVKLHNKPATNRCNLQPC